MNTSCNFFANSMGIYVGFPEYVIRCYCNWAVSDGPITITDGMLSAGLSSDCLLLNK